MATNVRTAVANRLGKSGTLSLKKDVFGIFSDDNPQRRSLLRQLELIETKPFVRVAQVKVIGTLDLGPGPGPGPPIRTVLSPSPLPQRDLDNANTIYQRECDAWVYCEGNITVDRLDLTIFDQSDCGGVAGGHVVSDDEDQLFDLGRGLGANIVCYYVFSATAFGGCAAHPPGRRGFWVGSGQFNAPASPLVAFAHELTHVVGDNGHVTTPANNLMTRAAGKPVSSTLTPAQQTRILADPDMEQP
jgi:hypothetical protein